MTLLTVHPRSLRFGAYEVNLDTGELRKGGTRIRLQEQPFQVLRCLLERPGKLVTREEIRERLWGNDTFVDFEHGLNAAINRLRECLCDSAEAPRFIETFPRRGYRFLAEVEPVTEVSVTEVEEEEPVAGEGGSPTEIEPPKWRKYVPWLATTMAALLIIGAAARLAQRQRPVTAPVIHSIAVLPLVNLSGDPEQEYFAEGMTDVLITDLARASALRVISHTTANAYKRTQKALPEIAQELNVDAMVEGTIMRSGNRVRISAQLIRAVDDRHLWAESYEGELGDVLLLQNRVAGDIAREVNARVTLPQQGTISGRVQPGAYDAYLRGRYFFDKRKPEAARKSAEYFQQAISIDPSYAPAYAGLAYALASESHLGNVRPAEVMPQALAATKRALELDPNCGEAHMALGFIDTIYTWDWADAERELQRGIELSPSDSLAEHYYSVYLDAANRPEEAIAHMRRALELDPLSFLMNRHLGSALYFGRHYDEALYQLRRAGEMQPNSADVVEGWASSIYEKKGLKDEAVHSNLVALEAGGETRANLNYYQLAYQRGGWKGYWQARIERLSAQSDKLSCRDSYDLGTGYLRLGNRDLAFSWLNWEAEHRCIFMIWVKVDPLLDDIRTDLRYRDLLRRMNLPE